MGMYVILAGLGNSSGTVEFWNAAELEVLAVNEHFMATDIDWVCIFNILG